MLSRAQCMTIANTISIGTHCADINVYWPKPCKDCGCAWGAEFMQMAYAHDGRVILRDRGGEPISISDLPPVEIIRANSKT